MKNRIALFCLIVLILPAVIVFAHDKGQEEIVLDGGKMGNITFPHHRHHVVVNDCMVCHKDFSKEPGSILAAKKSGTLKRKQVMNKTCLKCHRDFKKAGKKYGPVSCSGCHTK